MGRIRVFSLIDGLSGGAGKLACSIMAGTPDFEHMLCAVSGVTSFDYGLQRDVSHLSIPLVFVSGADIIQRSASLKMHIEEFRADLIVHHWWEACETQALLESIRKSDAPAPRILISHNNDPSPPGYNFYVSVSRSNACFQAAHIILSPDGLPLNHKVIRNAVSFSSTFKKRDEHSGISMRVGSLQSFKIASDWTTFIESIGSPHRRHYLVGDGPLLSSFKLDVSPFVRVTGPLSNKGRAMRRLAEHADVYLQESVKPEAGSLAVLEALSAGIPVVCDRLGCLEEFVEDNVNGFLVGSRSELKERCIQLLCDRSVWRRLSSGGRERAGSYAEEHMCSSYTELFCCLSG